MLMAGGFLVRQLVVAHRLRRTTIAGQGQRSLFRTDRIDSPVGAAQVRLCPCSSPYWPCSQD